MSVIVPNVERLLLPILFWLMTMDNERFSMLSTLGLPYLGSRFWINGENVLYNCLFASAPMVSNTIEDFPEPDNPTKAVILSFGILRDMFFRLFSETFFNMINSLFFFIIYNVNPC